MPTTGDRGRAAVGGAVRIERLTALRGALADEWDRFAEAHPQACVGHAAAWAEVLRDAYGLEPRYLAARDAGGRICGLLPLMRLRTLGGRLRYVSMPFLDAAGVLAADREVERALLEAARALDAPVELRQQAPPGRATSEEPTRVDLFLPLGGGPELRWKALPARVRNQTRKAARSGLALATRERDAVADFHRVHRASMRALGSPPHAERLFRAIVRHFGDRVRIANALDGDRPVGGLVALHYAGAVAVPWASTLRSERTRCPNNLVYWDALSWAERVGAHTFDFGRSPVGSGTHRFKRGWGARERPLFWARLDAAGGMAAVRSDGDSAVLRLLARVWRQLPPALCDGVGPRLRQRIAS